MEKLKLKYSSELEKFAQQKATIHRLWNVDETTADFLFLTAVSRKAKYLLELGTSNGYSTFWLSLAAEINQAVLHTVEVDEKRFLLAKDNLKDRNNITMHLGLAEKIIPALASGIDFVFIDAGKPAYLDYLQLLIPRLQAGAVILADNITSHPSTTASYQAFLRHSPDFFSLVLPLESGLEMSIYTPDIDMRQ
jgi:predicted O-methyltransferase YrrM